MAQKMLVHFVVTFHLADDFGGIDHTIINRLPFPYYLFLNVENHSMYVMICQQGVLQISLSLINRRLRYGGTKFGE